MNLKAPFAVLFLVMTALVACQKDDLPPNQSANVAQLSIINLTGDQLNFFQNGNRLNQESTIYPLGATDYFEVFAGERTFQFKRNGSSDVLFNVNLNLDSLGSYSLFTVNQNSEDFILVNDDVTTENRDTALVRYINASPEDINFDVSLNDILKFENKAYKSASEFVQVKSGEKVLKISRTGSATVLVTDTIELTRGRAYTIFSKGLIGQGGNAAFGSGIILN